jgi:septal ring factor EnvC (AmiA/AmiB activator)
LQEKLEDSGTEEEHNSQQKYPRQQWKKSYERHNCLPNVAVIFQVSLNDMEAERDGLASRTADLEARLAGLEAVDEERQRLAEEVAALNKKNQFLFEELARERLRLESKIETLAEQSESRRRELAAVVKV